ncbi:hypothetical protein [Streptomyces sp. WAC07149]|uniref:hypothetical protein n=1 Tax=Streptomyces sp. WAC07149 TaxID=2487425 RepID=UPI0021AFC604|nr:hypothetical protein [Streptomyces sp. WAC07149]
MNEPLPRRTPRARQPEEQPGARIPWRAFAAGADVTGVYGQPSPALIARASRGWRKLGDLHARTDAAGEDGAARLPSWLHEGARVLDPARDREGIVQFIGEWEDPQTRRVIPRAVFLRPEGGGVEWVVADHQALRQADPH